MWPASRPSTCASYRDRAPLSTTVTSAMGERPRALDLERDLVDEAPPPVLPRLVRLDERVLHGLEVRAGVPAGRRVAAADVAAGHAHAQMHPAAAGAQAVLAAVGARFDRPCRVEVCTYRHTGTLPDLVRPDDGLVDAVAGR